MIKRKRAVRKEKVSDEEQETKASDDMEDESDAATTSAAASAQRTFRIWLGFIVLSSFMAIILHRTLSKLAFLRLLTLIPVFVCAYAGLKPKRIEQRILPLTLVLTVISGQFPAYLGAAIAAASIVLFSLATLPRGDRLTRPAPQTPASTILLATMLLVAVLLTENFMVWVVSATFEAGHNVSTAPPPLQDNGQILLRYFFSDLSKRQVVSLRRLWNVQWSLVACLGASFVVCDVFHHPKRQLFSLAVRAVLTLAAARFIRTVSFLLTVLPSQVKACYLQHYPNPPPTDTFEWILVGLLPASHGGCNDLIISGHATVTSTLACAAASVSNDSIFQTALWTLLVMDYAIEIYEGFHYSVDMWLGMVIVSLLWRVLQPLEHYSELDALHNKVSTTLPPVARTEITIRDVTMHSIPTLLAYLQAAILPRWFANGSIVLFLLGGAGIYVLSLQQSKHAQQQAYQHYAQHILLCMLLIAFAVYL